MKIGLTYDLRDDYRLLGFTDEEVAEFDSIRTIEAIEEALQSLGHETDRIGHLRHLVSRLASGSSWDLVFNIAEGIAGFGREAQIPSLLEAYGIPYTFSDPLTMALTLHKGMAKRVVRDRGVLTPDFAVIECLADLALVHLPYPLFAKPVAEGTGRGITAASKIISGDDLNRVVSELLEHYRQPVLLETFLPGREFTVGIVGCGKNAQALGVMEVKLLGDAEPDVYSYINKEFCENRVRYQLSDDFEARSAASVALAAWRSLGCRDAGRVDLRSDAAGVPNFMEVNPLAGLHPEHSDLPILCNLIGLPFRTLIERIITEALSRTATQTRYLSVVGF
jgi:D-alanine-D-alanine ligase